MSLTVRGVAAIRYNCSGQVIEALAQQDGHTLKETDIAASMRISKRTLARYLKAEGKSYRALRDQVLAKKAASYLARTDLSVSRIGRLLGYTDVSNFRRAFRRWSGICPRDYRLSQYQNPGGL